MSLFQVLLEQRVKPSDVLTTMEAFCRLRISMLLLPCIVGEYFPPLLILNAWWKNISATCKGLIAVFGDINKKSAHQMSKTKCHFYQKLLKLVLSFC